MERIEADERGVSFDVEEHITSPPMLSSVHIVGFSVVLDQLGKFRNVEQLIVEDCIFESARLAFFGFINQYSCFPLLERLTIINCEFRATGEDEFPDWGNMLKNCVENLTLSIKASGEITLLVLSMFNKFALSSLNVKNVLLNAKDVIRLFPFLQRFNGVKTYTPPNGETLSYIRRLQGVCRTERRKRLCLQNDYHSLEFSIAKSRASDQENVHTVERAVLLTSSEYAQFSILTADKETQTMTSDGALFDHCETADIIVQTENTADLAVSELLHVDIESCLVHASVQTELEVMEDICLSMSPDPGLESCCNAVQNSRELAESIDELLEQIE